MDTTAVQLQFTRLPASADRCEAAYPRRGTDGTLSWVRCPGESAAIHVYACIHEHVVTRVNCSRHTPRPGMVGCRACAEAGHDCDMTVSEVR